RLRFQMAPKDPATGAYSLGPRLYDPGISRFVGADFYAGAAANLELALDPLTANRYLYAGANPASMIDDGHGPIEWLRKKLQPFIHAPCGMGLAPSEQDRTVSSVCLLEGVEIQVAQVHVGPFSVPMLTVSKRAVATQGGQTGKGTGKKKTGGISKTLAWAKIEKLRVRVDVEFPTGGSTGNIHVQVKGPGAPKKYYIDNPNDLSALPRSIREDADIVRAIRKNFVLLEALG
ncbi:MAG: RHS repeat-associated core domain-containing protein, partial [Candidatus Methylomirabilales bacterium]